MSSVSKLESILKKITNWGDVDIGELKQCLLSVDANQRLSSLVNETKSYGNSTHFAASDGNAELIQCILELLTPEQHYALLHKPNRYTDTAVHSAAGRGHTDVLRIMRDSAPANWYNLISSKHGTGTPLHHAAIKSHTGTVEYIMSTLTSQQKCNLVRMTDRAGNTALHYAANQGHTETVRKIMFFVKPNQLVEFVNTQNNDGLTATEKAEMVGHQVTADCLHQHRSWAEDFVAGNKDEVNLRCSAQVSTNESQITTELHARLNEQSLECNHVLSQQQESISRVRFLEEQVQELKIENGVLAQRLKQSSATSEFAAHGLAELSAKLEKLSLQCSSYQASQQARGNQEALIQIQKLKTKEVEDAQRLQCLERNQQTQDVKLGEHDKTINDIREDTKYALHCALYYTLPISTQATE